MYDLPNGLADDPVFKQFIEAGYVWYDMRPFEDVSALAYPCGLRKKIYVEENGEQVFAFSLRVYVFNCWRIPNYPRNGADHFPRFMFDARVQYQEVDAGIDLHAINTSWRVTNVAEAELAAVFMWEKFGCISK